MQMMQFSLLTLLCKGRANGDAVAAGGCDKARRRNGKKLKNHAESHLSAACCVKQAEEKRSHRQNAINNFSSAPCITVMNFSPGIYRKSHKHRCNPDLCSTFTEM
jgi:hypothetical protein